MQIHHLITLLEKIAHDTGCSTDVVFLDQTCHQYLRVKDIRAVPLNQEDASWGLDSCIIDLVV